MVDLDQAQKVLLSLHKPSLDRVRCYRLKHYYDLVNKDQNKKGSCMVGINEQYQFRRKNVVYKCNERTRLFC